MKLNQEGAFQYENGKCGSRTNRPVSSEQPPNSSTQISLRHPRTLPHSVVCTYRAQEARTPNRSQRVFVMPSISFFGYKDSLQGSDTVTRDKLCLRKEMHRCYFGVTIPAGGFR